VSQQQNLRRVTYVRDVIERTRRASGEVVDMPTGETRVFLADGRSVTYDPIDAVRLGIVNLKVGATLHPSIMARGIVSGMRAVDPRGHAAFPERELYEATLGGALERHRDVPEQEEAEP
jgi:hypothetical protein